MLSGLLSTNDFSFACEFQYFLIRSNFLNFFFLGNRWCLMALPAWIVVKFVVFQISSSECNCTELFSHNGNRLICVFYFIPLFRLHTRRFLLFLGIRNSLRSIRDNMYSLMAEPTEGRWKPYSFIMVWCS